MALLNRNSDLNPIEQVWESMKTYPKGQTNQAVLHVIKGVQKFGKMMIPELCTHYINHIQNVMPATVTAKRKSIWF